MIAGLTGSRLLLTLPSNTSDYWTVNHRLGEDGDSQVQVQFLLSAYRFRSIAKLKNPKTNERQLGAGNRSLPRSRDHTFHHVGLGDHVPGVFALSRP